VDLKRCYITGVHERIVWSNRIVFIYRSSGMDFDNLAVDLVIIIVIVNFKFLKQYGTHRLSSMHQLIHEL